MVESNDLSGQLHCVVSLAESCCRTNNQPCVHHIPRLSSTDYICESPAVLNDLACIGLLEAKAAVQAFNDALLHIGIQGTKPQGLSTSLSIPALTFQVSGAHVFSTGKPEKYPDTGQMLSLATSVIFPPR